MTIKIERRTDHSGYRKVWMDNALVGYLSSAIQYRKGTLYQFIPTQRHRDEWTFGSIEEFKQLLPSLLTGWRT